MGGCKAAGGRSRAPLGQRAEALPWAASASRSAGGGGIMARWARGSGFRDSESGCVCSVCDLASGGGEPSRCGEGEASLVGFHLKRGAEAAAFTLYVANALFFLL